MKRSVQPHHERAHYEDGTYGIDVTGVYLLVAPAMARELDVTATKEAIDGLFKDIHVRAEWGHQEIQTAAQLTKRRLLWALPSPNTPLLAVLKSK